MVQTAQALLNKDYLTENQHDEFISNYTVVHAPREESGFCGALWRKLFGGTKKNVQQRWVMARLHTYKMPILMESEEFEKRNGGVKYDA